MGWDGDDCFCHQQSKSSLIYLSMIALIVQLINLKCPSVVRNARFTRISKTESDALSQRTHTRQTLKCFLLSPSHFGASLFCLSLCLSVSVLPASQLASETPEPRDSKNNPLVPNGAAR